MNVLCFFPPMQLSCRNSQRKLDCCNVQ
jgi:hypothetical protein